MSWNGLDGPVGIIPNKMNNNYDIVRMYKNYNYNKSRIDKITIDISDHERTIKAQDYNGMPYSTEVSNPTFNEVVRRLNDTELNNLKQELATLQRLVELADIRYELVV